MKIPTKIKTAIFLISNKCNQNCLFCYNNKRDRNRNEPTLKDILKKIDYFSSLNCDRFVFSGEYEPTLRKDLHIMLNHVFKKGKKARIVTNGLRLSNKDYIMKILNDNLAINMGFNAHNKELYGTLSRTKNMFKYKIKALENFNEFLTKKEQLEIVIVVNKLNYKHLLDITKLVKTKFDNPFKLKIKYMIPTEKNKTFCISLNQLKPHMKECINYTNKNNIGIYLDGFPLCFSEEVGLKNRDSNEAINKDIYLVYHTNQRIEIRKSSVPNNNIKSPTCEKCENKKVCFVLDKHYVDINKDYHFNPFLKLNHIKDLHQ